MKILLAASFLLLSTFYSLLVMVDFHIHTCHSIDAQGTLQEYCDQALKIGLEEICFTNHCEIDPERNDNLIKFNGEPQPIMNEGIKKLQNDVIAVRNRYRDRGLSVRFGMEVGYFTDVGKRLYKIMEGINPDYLLAGVHCLDHVCIDSSREYEKYFAATSAEELLKRYYGTIEELVQTGLFDAVAHFDIYKKYGLGFYGEKINVLPEKKIAHIFSLMVENKTALEINTAGLRRSKEFYPDARIMKLARDAGINLLTVGSDCHKPDHLGLGIKEALMYAKSFGFDAVYSYVDRKPVRITI